MHDPVLVRKGKAAWLMQDTTGDIYVYYIYENQTVMYFIVKDKEIFKLLTEGLALFCNELFPEILWDDKLAKEISKIMDDD
jgi:hypothetical protein